MVASFCVPTKLFRNLWVHIFHLRHLVFNHSVVWELASFYKGEGQFKIQNSLGMEITTLPLKTCMLWKPETLSSSDGVVSRDRMTILV